MTRFSIFGYYGQGNAGDEAILSALVDGIKNELPNARISVCSANLDETKQKYGVNSFRFFGIDFKSIIKGILGRSRIGYLNAVISFLRSNVIIIGGGGLFYDTKDTNEWFFGYINLIHRAKKFGKKVALVGISVGPLHHKSSEQAIKKAFALVDLISVRDNTSRDTLIRCGVPANKIHVIPDLVFTLTSADESRISEILASEGFPNNGKRNIALTPCCYNTKQAGWKEQYVAFCERAIAELDCNLWLIPMQRNESHDDLSAINSIRAALSEGTQKRTFALRGHYSAKEIQGVLSKANSVLAERLHGSIMAINTNTPVLSIAYMPKVVGVLELAKLEDRIITNAEFLSGAFQNKAVEFYNRSIESQSSFESTEQHPRQFAVYNFTRLRELAGV